MASGAGLTAWVAMVRIQRIHLDDSLAAACSRRDRPWKLQPREGLRPRGPPPSALGKACPHATRFHHDERLGQPRSESGNDLQDRGRQRGALACSEAHEDHPPVCSLAAKLEARLELLGRLDVGADPALLTAFDSAREKLRKEIVKQRASELAEDRWRDERFE